MAAIEARAEQKIELPATSAEALYALLVDAERSGPMYPDVASVEKVGESRFHYVLEEQSTAGIKFRGDYVAEYTNRPASRVEWKTVSGNLAIHGLWKLMEGAAGSVSGHLVLSSTIEMTMPRLIVPAVRAYARRKLQASVDGHIEAMRKHFGLS